MPTFRDDLHLGHSVPMVDTEDIVDGAITEPKLADDSVSTRTIQDGAVTEPKIAEKAVTEPKLADAAVSTRTIKFRAVTESKIGDSAVSTRTIQNGAVTNPKIANGAVSMNKLDNETQTLIQRGADSSWTPKGDFNIETTYDANDVVFDPVTNSSYLSLRADNTGHPVDENDEEYEEGWWMKVLDGSYVNRAIEEMEAAIAQAIEDAQEDIDDAIAGANTAAQTANTAAANADTKMELIEQQVSHLIEYEVADALDEDGEYSLVPVQNKVVSKEIHDTQELLSIDNIYDLSAYPERRYAIRSATLDYTNSYTGYMHKLIPVTAGKRYVLSAASETTYYAWMTSSEMPSKDADAPVSTEDRAVYTLAANTSAIITASSDARFIYIRTKGISQGTVFDTTPKSFGLYDRKYEHLIASVDFNLYAVRNFTLGEYGWNTNTSRKHRAVPVPENAKYVKITNADSTHSSMLYFLKSYTVPSSGDVPDFCDGYNRRVDGGGLFEIPSDCTYIVFADDTSVGNRTPYPVEFYSNIGIEERLESCEETAKRDSLVKQSLTLVENSAAWTGASYEVNSNTRGFLYKVCAKNTRIFISVDSQTVHYYLLRTFAEPANGTIPNFCSGFESRQSAATSRYVTLPEDCRYVLIGLNNSNGVSYAPKDVTVYYHALDVLDYNLDSIGNTPDYPRAYNGRKIDLLASSLRKKYSESIINVSYNLGKWSNNNSKAQQSFAAFAGYGFVWFDTGLLKVIKMSDYSHIASITPVATNYTDNHAGNANFGTLYYDEADVFPLLYLSSFKEYKCYVLRIVPIVNEDGSYSFNSDSIILVQTIYYQDEGSVRYGHFYPTDDGFMWVHRWVEGGTNTYIKFKLPALSDSVDGVVNLDYANELDRFTLTITNKGMAGQVCRNGYIYALCYWKPDNITPKYDEIVVIDPMNRSLAARIPITSSRLNSVEFEGIEIYDGKIFIGYNNNPAGSNANFIGIIESEKAVGGGSIEIKSSAPSNVFTALIGNNLVRLKGATLNIIGDSVSNPSRSGYSISTVWWGVMTTALQMNIGTYSCISGTGVAGSASNSFHNRISSMTLNGGVTIIAGGMNDLGYANTPLGTFDYTTSLDEQLEDNPSLTDNFIPAYRKVIEYILKNNKNTRLYLCTITPRAIKKTTMTDDELFFPWTNPTTQNNWAEFNEAIRKLAHDYGVGLIDFANIGMYQQNGFADESEVLPADNIWTDDGVHPKVAYQKKMGDLATRVLAETMF